MIDEQERLTDPSDIASRNEEFARLNAINASRQSNGPKYTGYCLYCGSECAEPRRWCNGFCRDFWERDQ